MAEEYFQRLADASDKVASALAGSGGPFVGRGWGGTLHPINGEDLSIVLNGARAYLVVSGIEVPK